MTKHFDILPAVTGVLLAAGGSTRLGQPKQLLSWRGQPLIIHAMRQLWDAGCSSIVIVLGSSADQCRQVCHRILATESDLRPALIWLENEDWMSGQASSLRLALEAIITRGELANPFVVTLVDQPEMSSRKLRVLMEAVLTGRSKVAATDYAQGGGVPACFRHDCARELLKLERDSGAKTWIRQQSASDVALFQFGSATMDIDTAEDWNKLARQQSQAP